MGQGFAPSRRPRRLNPQTDDFVDSAFCPVIGCKPFLGQCLRPGLVFWVKHFQGQLGQFLRGAVDGFHLQLDRGEPVAQFGLLGGECVLIELIGQPHVEQS